MSEKPHFWMPCDGVAVVQSEANNGRVLEFQRLGDEMLVVVWRPDNERGGLVNECAFLLSDEEHTQMRRMFDKKEASDE